MFPQVDADINAYVLHNLDFFTVEMMQNHLFRVMISKLLGEIRNKGEEEILGYKYLQMWTDKPLSHMTVSNCIHDLKFSYLAKVKSSMFDGHKHEEQKKHCAYLTSEYTTAMKPRCHCWVKMPVAKFNEFPDRQEILNAG